MTASNPPIGARGVVNPHVRLAEDAVPARTLLVVIVAMIVVGVLACLWALVLLQRGTVAVYGVPDVRAVRPPAELPSGLRTTSIQAWKGGLEDRAAARAELSRWRWVDREKGIVGVPIERAMDAVAREGGGR